MLWESGQNHFNAANDRCDINLHMTVESNAHNFRMTVNGHY